MDAVVVLTAGELQGSEPVAQPPQAGVIVTRQRYFDPHHAQPLQLQCNLERGLEAPLAVAAEPGQHACLVGIDQDAQAVSEGASHGLDDADVIARIVGMEAQLHRLETLVENAVTVLDATFGGTNLAGRAVGCNANGRNATELYTENI